TSPVVGPSSHSRPSQRRPLRITSTASCVLRAASVSSMRKMNVPPVWRAYSQLNSAVRAPPMCKKPVGLGANRTRTFIGAGRKLQVQISKVQRRKRYWHSRQTGKHASDTLPCDAVADGLDEFVG